MNSRLKIDAMQVAKSITRAIKTMCSWLEQAACRSIYSSRTGGQEKALTKLAVERVSAISVARAIRLGYPDLGACYCTVTATDVLACMEPLVPVTVTV